MARPESPAKPDVAARPESPAKPVSPAKPDVAPPAAPAKKDAPRTMRELRLAEEGRKKAPAKAPLNPLREGLRLERVPDPATFVLFGATGDLAHRKVIPALYQLWRTNLLPHEFVVLAIGRRPYDDDSLRADFRA
ncbi:MAG TPA: hypothetical protein VGM28_05465, partial [Candidatus Limnocylindrales bacterium]